MWANSAGAKSFIRVAQAGLIVVSAVYAAALAYVVISRISYPFDLERMEGAMVDQVARVLRGEPLYVAPTLEFVPFIYGPFYFYVSAALASVMGLGFLPLRLVSLFSSLAVLLLVYAFIRRETGQRVAAIIGAGLFTGLFRLTGAWFDVGRVDPLALASFLFGAYLVRFHTGRVPAILAALALTLAVLTKQSMLAPAGLVALYVLVYRSVDRRRFAVALTVLLAGSMAALEAASSGWFSYYIFTLPSQHPIADQLFGFWTSDVKRLLPVVAVLAAGEIICLAVTDQVESLVFYGCVAAGLVANSWISRLHAGGWDNVLLPGFTALVLLSGLLLGRLMSWRSRSPSGVSLTVELTACAALMLQFALMAYRPQHQIPTDADRETAEHLRELVLRQPGQVLIFGRGFLSEPAGKGRHAHWQGVVDVLRGSDTVVAATMRSELEHAFAARRFSMVILDEPEAPLESALGEHYRLDPNALPASEAGFPVTGARQRPRDVYVPK